MRKVSLSDGVVTDAKHDEKPRVTIGDDKRIEESSWSRTRLLHHASERVVHRSDRTLVE